MTASPSLLLQVHGELSRSAVAVEFEFVRLRFRTLSVIVAHAIANESERQWSTIETGKSQSQVIKLDVAMVHV